MWWHGEYTVLVLWFSFLLLAQYFWARTYFLRDICNMWYVIHYNLSKHFVQRIGLKIRKNNMYVNVNAYHHQFLCVLIVTRWSSGAIRDIRSNAIKNPRHSTFQLSVVRLNGTHIHVAFLVAFFVCYSLGNFIGNLSDSVVLWTTNK